LTNFERYIGIDYSGAQTPTASLPGLRAYLAEGDALAVEIGRHHRLASIGRGEASPNGW
jgi:hypothetical protein